MVVASAPVRRSQRLSDLLDLLSIQIDALLESVAGKSLLEARRQITRDLHFEPSAEELQTIVGMAGDESTSGPRYELPRRFLRMRLLAEKQFKHVLETKTLNAEAMNESAEILREMIGAVQRLEAELERAVSGDESLNKNDRDYLLKAGEALSCSPDELVANMVLAHRLAELAQSLAIGNLEDMEPTLSASEREQFAVFAAENITQETCRAAIDAIAIRSQLERLFNAWREFDKPSEDDDAKRSERNNVLARMKQSMAALESVSTRLQTRRDAALVANVESLAAELQEAKRSLFSIKLNLAPILRDPYVDVDYAEQPELDTGGLREQLRASAAEEAQADGGRAARRERRGNLPRRPEGHAFAQGGRARGASQTSQEDVARAPQTAHEVDGRGDGRPGDRFGGRQLRDPTGQGQRAHQARGRHDSAGHQREGRRQRRNDDDHARRRVERARRRRSREARRPSRRNRLRKRVSDADGRG